MADMGERGPCRVLVVDDEPLIALDLAMDLEADGFTVVGPAATVKEALGLVDHKGCDVAVLDVNLAGMTAEPVAQALIERGIPFVIVSGYSRDQQASIFHDAILLTKPAEPGAVVAAVREVWSSRDAGT
jgi:DNA-binding response OmpR family regulator